jgi:hypothetical protein
MTRLREGQTIFGALEEGQLAADFGRDLTALVAALQDHVGGRPKATAKGKLTLTVDVSVDGNGMVEIDVDLATKKPRPARRTSHYWSGPEGELLTEHPQQSRFDFPARAAGAVS